MKVDKHLIPAILAVIVVGLAFGVITFVLSGSVPLTGEQGIIVGSITTGCVSFIGQILNFYFGSTTGSKAKDNIIEEMSKK